MEKGISCKKLQERKTRISMPIASYSCLANKVDQAVKYDLLKKRSALSSLCNAENAKLHLGKKSAVHYPNKVTFP